MNSFLNYEIIFITVRMQEKYKFKIFKLMPSDVSAVLKLNR